MNEFDAHKWREALRRLLGDEQAEEIIFQLEKMGIDPSQIDMSTIMGNDSQLANFLQDLPDSAGTMNIALGSLINPMSNFDDDTQNEAVNWKAVLQIAGQQIASKPDPIPTAAQSRQIQDAFSRANLWLDSVTSFNPPNSKYAAWSRSDWLTKTAPTWEEIVSPLAQAMNQSLSDLIGLQLTQFGMENLPDQIKEGLSALGLTQTDEISNQMSKLMAKLSSNMFSLQLGMALASLATESFGTTDIGLPLAKDEAGWSSALVICNVEDFSKGLAQSHEEVLAFLSAREAAYQRLYKGVPWLRHHVLQAIKDYASGITFDLDQITELADQNNFNPEEMMNSFQPGMLKPKLSATQNAAIERLEVILALMEGWVEEVSAAALMPYLPSTGALREMMRRRRATGGPAEQTFASLVGVKLTPKRVREAANMWAKILNEAGPEEREKLWSHPDLLPQAEDMDDLGSYLERRMATEQENDDLTSALNALLDGSLGYAKGLNPGDDSQGDKVSKENLNTKTQEKDTKEKNSTEEDIEGKDSTDAQEN